MDWASFNRVMRSFLVVPHEEEKPTKLAESMSEPRDPLVERILNMTLLVNPLVIGKPRGRRHRPQTRDSIRVAGDRYRHEMHRKALRFLNPLGRVIGQLIEFLKRPLARFNYNNRISQSGQVGANEALTAASARMANADHDDAGLEYQGDKDRRAPEKIRPRYYVILIFVLYVVTKLMVITYYSMNYRKNLKIMKYDIRQGANRTEFCVSRQDVIDKNPKALIQSQTWNRQLLNFIGFDIFFGIDTFAFLSFGFVLMAITFYGGSIINRNRELTLDGLSFMANPIVESKRVRRRLEELLRENFANIDQYQLEPNNNKFDNKLDTTRHESIIEESINERGEHEHHESSSATQDKESQSTISCRGSTLVFRSVAASRANSEYSQPSSQASGLTAKSACGSDNSAGSRNAGGHQGQTSSLMDRSYLVAKNCSCRYSEHIDRAELLQLIENEKLLDLVKPASLEPEVHRDLFVLQKATIVKFMSLLVASILSILLTSYLVEGKKYIDSRIVAYECFRWNPNSGVPADPYGGVGKNERYYLWKYDKNPSLFNYLWLYYKLNWKSVFKLTALLYVVEILIYSLLFVLWTTLYVMNLSVNNHSMRIWNQQMQAQLRNCISLLELSTAYILKTSKDKEKLRRLKVKKSTNNNKNKKSIRNKNYMSSIIGSNHKCLNGKGIERGSAEVVQIEEDSNKRLEFEFQLDEMDEDMISIDDLEIDEDYEQEDEEPVDLAAPPDPREQIERALTITYLNFELFKSEFISFQVLQTFISGQLTFFVITLTFTAMFVARTNFNTIIWATAAITLLSLNVLIVFCVSSTSNLQHIYRLISDLVAKSSECGMELTYIVKRWRRRLMTNSEIQSIYSTHVLSFRLSRASLLTLNTSLVGLWLLIHRFVFSRDLENVRP